MVVCVRQSFEGQAARVDVEPSRRMCEQCQVELGSEQNDGQVCVLRTWDSARFEDGRCMCPRQSKAPP